MNAFNFERNEHAIYEDSRVMIETLWTMLYLQAVN